MTILEIIDQLRVQDQIKTALVDYATEHHYSIDWPLGTTLLYEDDMPANFNEGDYFYLEDNLGCKWFLVQQHSLNN